MRFPMHREYTKTVAGLIGCPIAQKTAPVTAEMAMYRL
jgi:hypothetical protein